MPRKSNVGQKLVRNRQ